MYERTPPVQAEPTEFAGYHTYVSFSLVKVPALMKPWTGMLHTHACFHRSEKRLQTKSDNPIRKCNQMFFCVRP